MIRALHSSWLTALIGCLIYLGVTAALIHPEKFARARTALAQTKSSPVEGPSWKFRNPEFEQWVEDVRRQREALGLREQQLQELQTRLESERQELNVATQIVFQLQVEFDKNVVRIKDQEIVNLKRQAKVLATMSPEAAASLVGEMIEDDAVRILVTMKPDEASAILENLSKIGKAEARRAAALTGRMRRALPPEPDAHPRNSS